MSFKIVLACCSLLAVVASKDVRSGFGLLSSRIIGGEMAGYGEFPHQVSIQVDEGYGLSHICGGSIINNLWVLTAAHCVQDKWDRVLYVKAGINRLFVPESDMQQSRVFKRIVHERYPTYPVVAYPYDIAMLKLETPLAYTSFVQPVALPRQNDEVYGQVTLSGWGSISPNEQKPASALQKINLPVVPNRDCKFTLEKVTGATNAPVESTNFCTGPLGPGVAACNSDYGGPLVQRGYNGKPVQVGIVSWGVTPCATLTGATVHTKVSNYVNWITRTMIAN